MIEALQTGEYDFIVVNFANGDMVGHTAVRDAIIAAVEALDREVGACSMRPWPPDSRWC